MHRQICAVYPLHRKLPWKKLIQFAVSPCLIQTHIAFTLHIFQRVCMAAVGFCCEGLKGSSRSCVLMLFNYYEKKAVGIMLMSSYTHTHTHTLSSWVCRVSLFLPGKGLSENLRGRQEGTRWRPLQIWLLLTVLWSAHVYLLSQHWYLGLCGAWDAGPSLFEVKLIPQTTLLVIAPSLFSLTLFSLTPPYLLPILVFFFFSIFHLNKMRFGGCRWGAFNVIVGLFTFVL